MEEQDSKTYQLIDDFLRGNLSEKESAILNEKINTDKTFAEKVKMHQLIIDGIKEYEENEIKNLIQKADNELDNHAKRKLKRYWIYSFTSSAALILIVLGIYFMFFHESMSQKIFQEYYTIPSTGPNIKARGEPAYLEFLKLSDEDYIITSKAIELYNNKNFHSALAILNSIKFNPDTDQKILFFKAICEIETKNTKEAIRILNDINSFSPEEFQHTVQWYLALCYLKQGDTQAAGHVLKKIIKPKNKYSDKAREIIEKIDTDI